MFPGQHSCSSNIWPVLRRLLFVCVNVCACVCVCVCERETEMGVALCKSCDVSFLSWLHVDVCLNPQGQQWQLSSHPDCHHTHTHRHTHTLEESKHLFILFFFTGTETFLVAHQDQDTLRRSTLSKTWNSTTPEAAGGSHSHILWTCSGHTVRCYSFYHHWLSSEWCWTAHERVCGVGVGVC